MSGQPQPDLQWGPLETRPQNRGRVWLIVGAVVSALVIAGVLLFLLLPRGESAEPAPTPTPSTPTSPTDDASPTADPEPSMTPVTTPPPAVDPSAEAFRGQVGFWLEDASRGLDIVADSSGQDAAAVVQTLTEDAQRMSDAQPPSSIAEQWRTEVTDYARSLADLQSAISAGSGTSAAVEGARSRLQALSELVGL